MSRNWDLVREVVDYFNNNRSTVRKTAEYFKISKTTVYDYLTKVSPNSISREILDENKSERSIRGGQATKNKFLSKRS